MKKLSNITGIILFIVIAFCSCTTKKDIEKAKAKKYIDSTLATIPSYTPLPMYIPPYRHEFNKTVYLTRKQFLRYKFREGDWGIITSIPIVGMKKGGVIKMEIRSYNPFFGTQDTLYFGSNTTPTN